MRQAITTKFFGPTSIHGSRIQASAKAGRIYYTYRHDYNLEMNHTLAAQQYAEHFKWYGTYNTGVIMSGEYVHVLCEGDHAFTAAPHPFKGK